MARMLGTLARQIAHECEDRTGHVWTKKSIKVKENQQWRKEYELR